MKSFNVIYFNFNSSKFEPYDIMPYLVDKYKESKKKDKPTTREGIKEFIRSTSMYMWWGKCEYEIILEDFPCSKIHEKVDIYQQIMMNINIITDIFIENINYKGEE